MSRSTPTQIVLAAAAVVAGSLWLGVATATAVVFMVFYALHTWRTA